MTNPEVLQSGPTPPSRRPVMVAVVAVAAIIVLLQVWTAQSRPQPVPTPPPSSTPVVPTRTSHRLDAGAILIETAAPRPEDSENRIFELYRDHHLLDSGSWEFDQPNLDFTFQGTRGRFVIHGSHLVMHEPVRYPDWTWEKAPATTPATRARAERNSSPLTSNSTGSSGGSRARSVAHRRPAPARPSGSRATLDAR